MKEHTPAGIRCCEQALVAVCSQIALFWASGCGVELKRRCCCLSNNRLQWKCKWIHMQSKPPDNYTAVSTTFVSLSVEKKKQTIKTSWRTRFPAQASLSNSYKASAGRANKAYCTLIRAQHTSTTTGCLYLSRCGGDFVGICFPPGGLKSTTQTK